MYKVDIRVRPGELSRRMSEMRMWLDEYRFELSTFSCRDQSFGVLVSVAFRAPQQADAFAERFGGHAEPRQSYANSSLAELEGAA